MLRVAVTNHVPLDIKMWMAYFAQRFVGRILTHGEGGSNDGRGNAAHFFFLIAPPPPPHPFYYLLSDSPSAPLNFIIPQHQPLFVRVPLQWIVECNRPIDVHGRMLHRRVARECVHETRCATEGCCAPCKVVVDRFR